MPDSYGLATFSLSASTQDALVAKLRDEIVACYKEDHGQISLNKFVKNEFFIFLPYCTNLFVTVRTLTQLMELEYVVHEAIFQLSESLFTNAPRDSGLPSSYGDCLIFSPKSYIAGIPPSRPLQELAFVCGVVVALSIIHLS